jgi:glycosyltransferase involved in cell wall biosynthesis
MNGKAFELMFFGFGSIDFPYTRIGHEILIEASSQGSKVSAYFVRTDKTDFISKDIKQFKSPNWFKSKGLTYINYCIFSFFHVLAVFMKNPNTCFIVPTTPPFILPFVMSLAKLLTFGRLKWVYHVQDIHPEISFVGKIKTTLSKLLKKLDSYFIINANLVVTLSEEMKTALCDRGNIKADSVHVVNNFVEPFHSSKSSFDFIEEDRSKGKTIFIFAGNVGKFQRVAEVTKLFLEAKVFNGVFYILGDGEELPTIKALIAEHKNSTRVKLLGRRPFSEANDISSQCDYGIVSLTPEITKYAYPSKFAMYTSMGLKVLGFVDKNSQIATEITNHNIGDVIVTNDDLDNMLMHADTLGQKERLRIKTVSKLLFDKNTLILNNINIMGKVFES